MEVPEVRTIEKVVEVPKIQIQEVVRHASGPQGRCQEDIHLYMLSCPVLTHPPPMVWSPLALARGLGPGLRLGKTTSQPSSLYLYT